MSKSLDRIWKDFQGVLTRAHEFILTKESSPLSGGFSSVLTFSYTWFDFCIRNELVLKVNKLTFFYQVKKNDIVLLPFKLRKAEKQIKNSADVKRSPQILNTCIPLQFFLLSFVLFHIYFEFFQVVWGSFGNISGMYVDLCCIYWYMLAGSSLWRDLKDG